VLSYGFKVHLWLGSLISLAMLVSSITALTLFPALVLTFRPPFVFESRNSRQAKGSALGRSRS
jgi:hypothetical protein